MATTDKGRKVFTDADDENYSEKTVTVQAKDGMWYNVPSVTEDGKILDPEILERVYFNREEVTDPVTGEVLLGFESIEEAVSAAQKRSDGLKYNEGGMATSKARKKTRSYSPVENTEEALGSVPFFSRPMSSGPNDKATGAFDEAGNPEYITPLGQRYTVQKDPDQRTTRAKIEEDVVPAAKEYLKDPYLPSKEQVGDALGSMAQGAIDTATGAVEGSGTYGDAFSMAASGGILGATKEVPEGAITLFGGRRSHNFPTDKMDDFIDKRGGDRSDAMERELWDEMGLSYNKENAAFEYEIPTSGMKMDTDKVTKAIKENYAGLSNYEILDQGSRWPYTTKPFDIPLKDVMDFPELFDSYPNLENTKLRILTKQDGGGHFDAYDNAVAVGFEAAQDPEELRRIVIHELQHGIQAIEGTDGGFSPQYLLNTGPDGDQWPTSPDPEIQADLDFMTEKYNKLMAKGDSIAANEYVKREYGRLQDEVNKRYLANVGETQSRAAEARDQLTTGELKETTPTDSYREALRVGLKKYKGGKMETQGMDYVPKYNEGGLVEDQMKFAFMQGGMATDGMEEDPVSGNEIPPGSTAKEVRDDVPVNVSEGEYIIPADVAQFYGMEKLEKMVFKAKEKLAEMEASGRMGDTGEDDLPLSDEELEMMDDPEAPPVEMTEEKMAAKGFATGGTVGNPTFDPANYSYGGSGSAALRAWDPSQYALGGSQAHNGVEVRSYINKEGRIIGVHFTNGQPTSGEIPEGFVPNTPEAKKALASNAPTATTTEETEVPLSVGDARGQNKEDTDYQNRERRERTPTDFSGLSNEDLTTLGLNADTRDRVAKGAGLVGTALGTPGLGALARGWAEVYQHGRTTDILAEATKRLEDGTLDQSAYDKMRASIEGEAGLIDNLLNGRNPLEDSKLAKAADFLGVDLGFKTTPTPTTTRPTARTTSRNAGYDPERINQTVRDPVTGLERQSAAPSEGSAVSQVRPQARPSNLNTSGSSGSSGSGSSSGSADSRDSEGVGGNRAKGGLIKNTNYKQGGLVKKRC